MELKVLIFLFITLPYNIYGKEIPKKLAKCAQQLNEYAKNGTKIANNSLILSENGFLGQGIYGFVWAGKLVEKDLPEVSVAIKFVRVVNIAYENEIQIFKKLNAYKNPKIEKIGIPNVYYYGEWESYYVTAMTKLDRNFAEYSKGELLFFSLDMMILFKNFVIQTKYMHRRKINHGCVHSEHIMFRSNQSFIIDFQISGTMTNDQKFRLSHKDWRQFLCMIAKYYNIPFDGGDWNATKNALQKHKLDKGLKTIMENFGDEAFSTDQSKILPNYKRVKRIINNEINRKCGHWRFSCLPN